MVLGSYEGMLYVLDHQGNIVNDLKIKAHENVVNEVMIDDRGEIIASCSDDGRIFVFELFTKNHKLSFNHGQSVKTINILSTYEDKSPGNFFLFHLCLSKGLKLGLTLVDRIREICINTKYIKEN